MKGLKVGSEALREEISEIFETGEDERIPEGGEIKEEEGNAENVIGTTRETYEDAVIALTEETGDESLAVGLLREEEERINQLEEELKVEMEKGDIESMAIAIQTEVEDYLDKKESKPEQTWNQDLENIIGLAGTKAGLVEVGLENTSRLVAYAAVRRPELELSDQIKYAEGLIGWLNRLREARPASAAETFSVEHKITSLAPKETDEMAVPGEFDDPLLNELLAGMFGEGYIPEQEEVQDHEIPA